MEVRTLQELEKVLQQTGTTFTVTGGKLTVEVTSKTQLRDLLHSVPFPFDISSIPTNALIENVVFDFSDPQDPRMLVNFSAHLNHHNSKITRTPIMPAINTFQDLDKLCQQARQHFRNHLSNKQDEIADVFNLFFDILKSIGKFKTPEEWRESRQEWTIALLVQSIETILGMYYLTESGFWDNALVLKRNFSEILTTAIAIGYDDQCFIDWKHRRQNCDTFEKIFKRATKSAQVPATEKTLLPHIKRYWEESSQLFSHNINPNNIRTLVKEGQIRFEPKTANAWFQERRMNTIRNMLLDVISVMVGVFDYASIAASRKPEFPEAPSIIERSNRYFQNEKWKKEETK